MRIIQSFAQFDDGSVYVNGDLKGTEIYLNFYTFFLSFLTLKKYYDSVTMYCNKLAYDTFIKYIPYDEIIIKENKYTTDYWSAYKLDIISEQTEDFIHVDSDVFIFDDLFKPFIDNLDKDIIVQFVDVCELSRAIYDPFEDVCSFDIFSYGCKYIYDSLEHAIGKSFSCGVVGMRLNVRDSFISNTNKIYNKMLNNIIDVDKFAGGFFLEEFTLYLTALNNNYTWCPVIDCKPSDVIQTIGDIEKCEIFNYTHMWFRKKYIKKNIDIIKNIINVDFNNYYSYIDEYEKKISNIKILTYTENVNNMHHFSTPDCIVTKPTINDIIEFTIS